MVSIRHIFRRNLDTSKDLFPSWPTSIQPFIIFWVFMFSLIATAGVTGIRNQYGAVNPFVIFPLAGLFFAAIALREAENFGELKTALGFRSPIPGFGILMILHGLGVGILIYSFWTGQLMKIQGSVVTASVYRPFYSPYTASASAFVFTGLASFAAVLMYHAYVASFEEIYKIGMLKNLSNWLHVRLRIPPTMALVIALVVVIFLWTLWHYFAWPELTAASIVMGFFYGLFFLIGYLILAITGIVPPGQVENEEIALVLSGVVIYPNIGSHYSWNVLVELADQGVSYDPQTLLVAGLALTIAPLIVMYVARQLYR